MRLPRIFPPVGLVVFAAGWGGAEEPPEMQSFVDYCAYVGSNFTGDHWLGAYCRNNMTAVFGYNYTWIDLDHCVGNNDSQLIAYDNGNYSTSCTKCATNHDKKTLTLTCSCPDTDKHWYTSSLDLNTTVYNENGSTGCFGHLGNKSGDDRK